MPDTFKNRLKEAINLRNMKQAELARRANVNKSSLSAWLNGDYEAKQDSVFKLAKALNVSEAWLMGLTDDKNQLSEKKSNILTFNNKKTNMLPIINVSAGLPEQVNDGAEMIEVPSFYESDYLNDRLFVIRVIGESMNKFLPNGSSLICKKPHDKFEVKSGDFVVYKKGGEFCIKKFVETDTLLIFEPMSFDNKFKPIIYNKTDLDDDEQVEIMGVVIYQFNRFK